MSQLRHSFHGKRCRFVEPKAPVQITGPIDLGICRKMAKATGYTLSPLSLFGALWRGFRRKAAGVAG